jgi:SAM-dependent methyltransferase
MGIMANRATGPGPLTEDGCSVEFYRRLSAGDEPEIVQSVLPFGATILELGAGAGRVTRPLSDKGYRVTAVDSSAEMLAQVTKVETVVGQIETLDLKRTFDGVLLGSHLVNTPDDRQRNAFLKTCRRHVGDDGVILIETYVPERIRAAQDGLLEESDGIRCFLKDLTREENAFSATLIYEAADATWTHRFSARVFDEAELSRQLHRAGLAFGEWLNARQSWFSACLRRSGRFHRK